MSNRKILLDPGHEGMAFGHYLRQGKQSPEVPPGIYEGEFNRQVCSLIENFDPDKYLTIAPGCINIPLTQRVSLANKLNRIHPCVYISVHANAAGKPGWSNARGFRIFHSKQASPTSRTLAMDIHDSMEHRIGHMIPARPIREVDFTVLSKTKCPSVLIECGFMTNKIDAELLSTPKVRTKIAMAIYSACEMVL